MPTYFDGNLVYIHIPKCAGKSVNLALVKYQEKLCPHLGAEALRFRWHESLFEVQNMFYGRWGKEKWNQAKIISTIRHPIQRAISWWKYNRLVEIENQKLIKKSVNSEGKKALFVSESACHPLITPQDHEKYNRKIPMCVHRENDDEFEKFKALSFSDYTKKMTFWKTSGCAAPDCFYHGLSPQVDWLRDITGKIPLAKLNLFTVEEIQQIQDFLPSMPPLTFRNESFEDNQRQEKDNSFKHLTTESLIALRRLYSEDFEIYDRLKGRPSDFLRPLDEKKLSALSSAG